MRKKNKKKRFLILLLCAFMICSFIPQGIAVTSALTDDGLCEHHTEHTEDCGYSEGVDGSPCSYNCQICSESEPDSGNVAAISENSVASVNGAEYDSLEAAYKEAAKNAGTIVLLKDISMDDYWLQIDSTVIVDLNGYSISALPKGFVFYIVKGGNLTLKGSGNVNGGNYTNGIIWNEEGILKMEDSVVLQKNDAGNGWCGAVYNTGEFIMDGGSIQNTSTEYSGGAIYNSGTFTMNNGTISQTSATWYGGAVYNKGTFTMNGGSISGTSATYYGGAVYNIGTLKMNGGILDSCRTTGDASYGGAIYNEKGNIVMDKGTISNCMTSRGGGGVHLQEGSFTMNNGTIESCKVTSSHTNWDSDEKSSIGGGGISARSKATITMNDGLIWKNKSSGGDGGGGIANAGTFIMSGGQIIMNDTTDGEGYSDNGGGVNNVGVMEMSGGMIAKNNGKGGIYSGSRDAKLTITGGAVFENYALKIFGVNVPEESKKVDIVLHTSHQGNDNISVCKASEMTAEGYTFTAWKYIGEGWGFAHPYVGQDMTGTLVPSESELSFTEKQTNQIYFRAVSTPSEIVGKEGIYLNGTLGDDSNDGNNAENAVRTFEKAWQLANDKLNEEEAVAIYVCGEVRVFGKETWGENNTKNIVVMRAEGYKGEIAKVTSGGELTLQNITIDGNKAMEYTDSLIHVMDDGKLLIKDGAVLQNNIAGRNKKGYDGGAVYIENGTGEMTGGKIQNNTARNNGGGVSVEQGVFTMSGGEIVKNAAVYGGGICAVRGGHIEIKDNALISENSALYGGGVNLGAYTTAEAYYNKKKQTLEMSGGTISANSADSSGGGIFIQSNSAAVIYKGNIVENKITGGSSFRYRGAGIYVNGGKNNQMNTDEEIPNGLLQLYNAEIAYNIANEYGGGLAACPTANVKIYVTDGAVFHDNKLATKFALDISIAESKNQNSTSYISDFMLGGGMYQWLWGDSIEGIRAEQSQYQNTASDVKLSGVCDDADVSKAVQLATVHITGNHAQRGDGGGIATNGDVIIGTPSDSEAEITVSKSWEDNNDKYNVRPDKIKLDIQYGEYTLRGIELTKEDNWTTTLHNMPNNILQQQDPAVNVLEYDSGDYDLGDVKAEIKESTLTINIANTYTPPEPAKAEIVAEKIYDNGVLKGGDFEFILKDSAGKEIEKVKNDKDGVIAFGQISYDREGEYTYTISEVKGNNPSITYDNQSVKVKVTVTKSTEKNELVAAVTYEKDGKAITAPVFKNIYTKPDPAIISFHVSKEYIGGVLKGGDFEFILRDSNGNLLQIVKNDEFGNINFEPIVFDANSQEEIFTYTISEINSLKPNVVYDGNIITVRVTVKKGDNNETEAYVVYETEKGETLNPTFINAYTPLPKTGDPNILMPYLMIMAISGTMAIVMRRKCR